MTAPEPSRYRVVSRVEIQRIEENGRYTADRISFEDVADLGPLDFSEIAALLMRFHEIGQGFRAVAS